MLLSVEVRRLTVSEIGARVRALREARGWSQRKLGALAGTSGSYISQLEAGKTPRPGVAMLQAIADALAVPMTDLTQGEPVTPREFAEGESLELHLWEMAHEGAPSFDEGQRLYELYVNVFGTNAEGQARVLDYAKMIRERFRKEETGA